MSKFFIKSFIFISLFGILLAFKNNNNNTSSAEEIITLFLNKTEKVKTFQLTIIAKERIKSKYTTRKENFKIQCSPFKVYMKEDFPTKGLEVLYVAGMNNNKAWVNPAAFPWTTLSLSPVGNMMRNGSHHSIYKSGYLFIGEVLRHLKTKYESKLSEMLKFEGFVNYNNILCHKITFSIPDFAYTTYKTLPKETMEDISNKLKVDDYMILERNPQLKSFEDIKPGMVLKVPADYGKSFTLYIEKETNLLLGIKVFDEIGLWEEYTYSNIKINPVFTTLDFSIDNPDYDF